MGFALWIDSERGVVWARGTHEYRPMGTAAIAASDRFRARDFAQRRPVPLRLRNHFVGFFGSLESVNEQLGTVGRLRHRETPAHLT